MANEANNLHKSDDGWNRLQAKAANRPFANRTDSRIRTDAVGREFRNAKAAAIAEAAEADS